MRISRRLRGLLAAAVTTGALLVLPGAAFAAPEVSVTVTKDASTPSIDPGAVVKYNVVLTADTADAVTGDGDILTVSASEGGLVSGGVSTADTNTGTDVTTFADGLGTGTRTFVIPAGWGDNAGDSQTLQFDVTLPATRKLIDNGDPFFVTVTNGGTDADVNPSIIDEDSASTDVFKGDGTKTSKLFSTWGNTSSAPAGLVDWWAPLNSTVTGVLTIHNWGDGPAYGVEVDAFTFFSTSPVGPAKPKADLLDLDFDPKATVVGSADCVANVDSTSCTIGEIPAGGSKSVQVNVAGLTHIGATGAPNASWGGGTLERNRSFTAPGWNDGDNFSGRRDPTDVKITDGKTVLPQLSLDGPNVGAGRTDIAYPFEIVNAGPDSITGSVLRVNATSFTDKGAPTGGAHAGDTGVIESIKSITLSNGSTCAPAIDHQNFNGGLGKYEPKAWIGTFDCGLAEIPAGVRVTGTVVANFATGRKDSTNASDPVGGPPTFGDTGTSSQSGSVSIALHTAQFNKQGSSTNVGTSTRLNRTASADLDVSVKSAKDIGAERLGLHVVTIKNNGPNAAPNVWLNGSLYKLVGSFEPTLLPGACTGVVVSSNVSCSIGDIASGQSVDITISVLGPKKVGSTLVATYSVGSSEWDTNDDNNSVAHVQNVVKASLAPLTGVKVAKAPAVLKLATLGKTGLKSTVTVPGPSVVVVDLQVSRLVAQKMGLVKAPKGSKARAKALSPFIKIGTGKKVMKANGNAVVFTKLSKAYKAKVLKLRKPLKAQRVVTVTSTATLTKGATSVTTGNLTIRK